MESNTAIATDEEIVKEALCIHGATDDCCHSTGRERLERLLSTRSTTKADWDGIVHEILSKHVNGRVAREFRAEVQFV